jgi:hypothetical protein
VRQWG